MHLYLKNGSQQRWLILKLEGGHTPRIAGFPKNASNEITNNLEPAKWFKLMVLDSVSIDCEKHVVCWTTRDSDDNDTAGKEHLMFSDEDQYCYDFDDDLDELFDIAMFLIKTNPMAELNDERRQGMTEDYQRCLFRLLHCYILGKVKLHPEDTNQVLQALEAQHGALSLVDEQVMMHKRIAEQFVHEMETLKETEILPLFDEIARKGGIGIDALTVLKQAVIEDVDKTNNEVDNLQARVDLIKKEMSIGATSRKTADNLAAARSQRDEAFQKQCLMLERREMLTIYEAEMKKKLPATSREPCLIKYLKLNEMAKREKELAREYCDKKVRAISVRECIESTLEDLEDGITSYGEEVTASGQKATDVISERECHTEWQTLTERLATIIHNVEHPVGRIFDKFTGEIRQRCNEVFRAYERFSERNAIAEVDGYLVVGSDEFSFNKNYLTELKTDIHRHLDELSTLLMESFQKNSQMFWRKLRLGYEKCFFYRSGDVLLRLYRLTYSSTVVDLEKRVACLRDIPVCRLGLQMKEEWWLSLFDPFDVVTDLIKSRNSTECMQSNAESVYSLINGGSISCCQLNYEVSYDTQDANTCYKNVDLMREKLQVGTAKVLSRSLSANELITGEQVDPVREGAVAMVQELSSKVKVSRSFVPYDRIFNSSRLSQGKVSRKSLNVTPLQCNTDHGLRSRSSSTPNFLDHEPQTALKCESKRSKLDTLRKDSFQKHFGGVLAIIKDSFSESSPLNKMQRLTAALRMMANSVMELRQKRLFGLTDLDRTSLALSAEDLLPLIVLILLKLKPAEVGKLYVELCYISDMMADFLSSGCHSYALTEFQIALRVLSQTCDELSLV